MRFLVSFLICLTVVFFSCTDRDDNLEGVQIRVQNNTGTAFSVVTIDSLTFPDIQPDQTLFYQQYEGTVLPGTVTLMGDSLSLTVTADGLFEIDTTMLNLFTYQIKGLTDNEPATIEIIKD